MQVGIRLQKNVSLQSLASLAQDVPCALEISPLIFICLLSVLLPNGRGHKSLLTFPNKPLIKFSFTFLNKAVVYVFVWSFQIS